MEKIYILLQHRDQTFTLMATMLVVFRQGLTTMTSTLTDFFYGSTFDSKQGSVTGVSSPETPRTLI